MSPERLERFQQNIAAALKNAAKRVDRLGEVMRKHEQHFNEDDFDELGRIAGQLYQIAERAKR